MDLRDVRRVGEGAAAGSDRPANGVEVAQGVAVTECCRCPEDECRIEHVPISDHEYRRVCKTCGWPVYFRLVLETPPPGMVLDFGEERRRG